jgi:hypothetical protein
MKSVLPDLGGVLDLAVVLTRRAAAVRRPLCLRRIRPQEMAEGMYWDLCYREAASSYAVAGDGAVADEPILGALRLLFADVVEAYAALVGGFSRVVRWLFVCRFGL